MKNHNFDNFSVCYLKKAKLILTFRLGEKIIKPLMGSSILLCEDAVI